MKSPAEVNGVNNVTAAPTHRTLSDCLWLHVWLAIKDVNKTKISFRRQPGEVSFLFVEKHKTRSISSSCPSISMDVYWRGVRYKYFSGLFVFIYLSHIHSFARNRTFCYWIYSVEFISFGPDDETVCIAMFAGTKRRQFQIHFINYYCTFFFSSSFQIYVRLSVGRNYFWQFFSSIRRYTHFFRHLFRLSFR